MKAKWFAKSLVPHGMGMKNKWVCSQCPGKTCHILLHLNEEPTNQCKEEL